MTLTRLTMAVGFLFAVPTPPGAIAQGGHWASVGGARLYYEQSGHGPAVILIHGLSLDHRMWAPQVDALSRHFRVVRYDVRGFGQSDPAQAGHDPVADLLGLMQHLHIRRARLVGMSMGGAIAVDFALTHPDRVASLVLIAGNINGFPHPHFGERFAPVFGAGRAGNLDSAKALWLRDPLVVPVHDSAAVATTVRTIIADCPCRQFADPRLMPVAATPAAFGQLESVAVPTLAINGESDDPDMLAIADAVEHRVPEARRLVVPDAGHLVNLEQPAAVNEALLAFLTMNH